MIQGLDLHRYSILPPLARPRLECNLPNTIHYCIYTFATLYVVSIAPALLSLHSIRCALFTVCLWLLVIPTASKLGSGTPLDNGQAVAKAACGRNDPPTPSQVLCRSVPSMLPAFPLRLMDVVREKTGQLPIVNRSYRSYKRVNQHSGILYNDDGSIQQQVLGVSPRDKLITDS